MILISHHADAGQIKCDKNEPVCHQCTIVKSNCQYVERRQRPRFAQQKVEVQHLTQRLDLLEKHIRHTADERSPSTSVPPTSQDAAPDVTPVPSPEASLTVSDGQECKKTPSCLCFGCQWIPWISEWKGL